MGIYLCGFMGCGKSTVALQLAKLMGCTHCDTDVLIVEREGMSIPQIFEGKGEKYFRQAETNLLREMATYKGVIACGGGLMLSAENAKIANSNGTVIFIDTPFELCYERISGDGNRPIAASKTREELEELFNQRYKLYAENSTFSVSGESSPLDIANQIIRLIK